MYIDHMATEGTRREVNAPVGSATSKHFDSDKVLAEFIEL